MEVLVALVVLGVFGGFIYWRVQKSKNKPAGTGTGGSGKDTPPKQRP